MLCILELRLRQDFLELSGVLGGDLVSCLDDRIVQVVDRYWHFDGAILGYVLVIIVHLLLEGVACVALRVLLHSDHRQLSLDLDRARFILMRRCRHWWQRWGHARVLIIDVDISHYGVPHRVCVLHHL